MNILLIFIGTIVFYFISILFNIDLGFSDGGLVIGIITILATFSTLAIPFITAFSRLNRVYGDSISEMIDMLISESWIKRYLPFWKVSKDQLRQVVRESYIAILLLIISAVIMHYVKQKPFNLWFFPSANDNSGGLILYMGIDRFLWCLVFVIVLVYGYKFYRILSTTILLHNTTRYKDYLEENLLNFNNTDEQGKEIINMLQGQRTSLELYYIQNLGNRYVDWKDRDIITLIRNLMVRYEKSPNAILLRIIGKFLTDSLSLIPTIHKSFYRIKYVSFINDLVFLIKEMLVNKDEELRNVAEKRIEKDFVVVAFEQMTLNIPANDSIASKVILTMLSGELTQETIDAYYRGAAYIYGVAAKLHPEILTEFIKSLYMHSYNKESYLSSDLLDKKLEGWHKDYSKINKLVRNLNFNEKKVRDYIKEFDQNIAKLKEEMEIPENLTNKSVKEFKINLLAHYHFLMMHRLCILVLANLAYYKRWDTILDIASLHNGADYHANNIAAVVFPRVGGHFLMSI